MLVGVVLMLVCCYLDFLGVIMIQMFCGIFFDMNFQYNQDIDCIMCLMVVFSWKLEGNKVINLGYCYYW